MVALDIVSTVLICVGCLLALTSGLGMLRMPDFYTRIHPAGKSDSLAQVLIVLGVILQFQQHEWPDIMKLLLVSLFLFVTTPVAAHATVRAAHLDGLEPWQAKEQTDD